MSDAWIRLAGPEDADALASLGRTTFIETFVDGFGIPYPAEDLRQYVEESFSVASVRARLRDSAQCWWTAERDGKLVGFASAGPNKLPHPESRPSHAELRGLYVARQAQGIGLGTRLLKTALEWMLAHTDGPLWIGVWSGNEKAQKLYAAHGFDVVGQYKYPIGSWNDDEFIMRRG